MFLNDPVSLLGSICQPRGHQGVIPGRHGGGRQFLNLGCRGTTIWRIRGRTSLVIILLLFSRVPWPSDCRRCFFLARKSYSHRRLHIFPVRRVFHCRPDRRLRDIEPRLACPILDHGHHVVRGFRGCLFHASGNYLYPRRTIHSRGTTKVD